MEIQIRNETSSDHRIVETITRKAFWNQHTPGCNEHFLAHTLRQHPDFIPELDLVLLVDGQVVGNIMYTHSYLLDEHEVRLPTITFGPVSVLPEYQKRGLGSRLIAHSLELAEKANHKVVITYGNPSHYCKFGFKGCHRYRVMNPDCKYPCSLLVKELRPRALYGNSWRFFESDAYHVDERAFEEYDATFEAMKACQQTSQEVYAILSHSYVEE